MSLDSWKTRAGIPAALVLACTFAPSVRAQISQGGPGVGASPPVITSITAKQLPGQKFRISGTVADKTPANCSITLTGVVTGGMRCDKLGNFSGDFNAPILGEVTAVATDGALSSQSAGVGLTNMPPGISVQATMGAGNTWTFSGTVTDEAPAGLTVSLAGPVGVNGLTATVAADGSWSVSVQLPEGTSGVVSSTVTDWYGATGIAYTSIQS
jgi:hypothetical protein